MRKLDKLRFIADSGTEYRVMVSESAYKTVQDIAKATGLSAKAVATKMINFAARNVEIVYGEEDNGEFAVAFFVSRNSIP